MQEQEIRVTTVLAAALWMAGVGMVVAGIMTGRNGIPALGVLLSMAGTTIQVRGFIASYEQRLKGAFELGREHERSLRSVR